MLPLQQAYEVKHSIIEYLKATFSFKDKAVHEAFYNFITDENDGIFKGHYVSLKLPFVKATIDQLIPLEIKPSFAPYDHQLKSFLRLYTDGDHKPKSTLVTTGTSSGKTECFLYPILDYCYKNQHRNGIKVIILYPMNALATDQAKRLAEMIWTDSRLNGKITAGLFIGEGKDKKKYPKDMGENHIIENRDSIVDSPPDILLTNFKMLDYALIRNHYHNLWSYNLDDPSLLQFLVLDELHTYDGAQGTDVANLIRRLKLKLGIEKGQICAVGTSATIGYGDDSKQLLTEYAVKVFGEEFDDESIITENRVSVDDFFELSDDELEKYIPRQIGLLESRLKENETYENYITRQKRLWQLPETLDQVALGEELKKLKVVKDLISLTSKNIKLLNDLIRELADINPDFKRLTEWDEANELNPREEVINSILALINEAKVGTDKNFPFLFLQIQIWIRELSGVLREFNKVPIFTWKDKVGDKYDPKALPSYFCRECGASGWLGIKKDDKTNFLTDPNQVYEYFFNHHKNIYFINTDEHKHIEEYEPCEKISEDYINVIDLSLHDNKGEGNLKIHAVRKLIESKSRHICPECNTENTINIIGTRIATLSSITVSQILASDLDPRTEKYRKILAFTNSVQDAAHQAGFVEARNYRFTFRSSLQKVVNYIDSPVNLEKLQEEFIDYWKIHSDETGSNNEEAYYYRLFPSDYKGKVDINTDYRLGKKFTVAFKKEFDERMRWEVTSEFGFNAIIGRTLEKSGSSAVKFDDNKLIAVFPAMKEWLSENILFEITESDFLPFINGILHRIRIRGGVDHEYLNWARSDRLTRFQLNWAKNNSHFFNRNYGKSSRLPKVIGTTKQTGDIIDITYTKSNNWYRTYFNKNFLNATSYQEIINDFYHKLFEVFVELGIMNCFGKEGSKNYAIKPESIIIENKVKKHYCNSCGSELNVAGSDNITCLTKCLDYTCKTGIYEPQNQIRQNYYQLVYNRNRSPRIYATEHTGLLERKDREFKETDFKERPNFNSLNAIVATSTLEMGIDIGTLNSAINNAVPPLVSNFLQRIGRAGRSSGSALITNFAQSKPHDLFYYEEPTDMMEGDITSPGCYLEAKDILFRHFFAYCLDNWASADPKNNSIPRIIYLLRLLNTDLTSPEFLGNRIISFIKSKESQLLNRFANFYRPDLDDPKVLDQLNSFLVEEGFYLRIKGVFSKLKAEYLIIQEKRKEIDEIIKVNKLPETDEERKILEGEKKALWGLKRLIDNRSTLEHLTNVGLLPNYAFPETGVTLNAWIKSNKAKASDNIPANKQFEIVRSSSVAIREFAPDNYFYSQGYKFSISGINTYDWKDSGILLKKRFCSECDHLADSAFSNENTCPKCGDSSWSSAKNQHFFVKINSVKSVDLREKSSLDDRDENRTPIHYNISTHIKFDNNTFQGAWGMKEIPFGIEYVKNVQIIDVNLGRSSSTNPNKISINSHENIPYHGFVTCKYCGKSTSEPHRKNSEHNSHFGYCKFKDREYQSIADEVFEEVYLFKEMNTEALKVLLPVQELESEAQISMFKAGLVLGSKKYYKGNPQHLRIINYSEFNSKTNKFDKYLVIYDTIPGGTGYLEKLFNPAEFTEVILRAYQAITECTCQFKGKDGCYRCIFTYSNQSNREELSRAKAESLFKKIVDKSNAWENYPTGLGSLSGTGQIEESELEERFIRSLKNYLKINENNGFLFEEFIEDAVTNYKIKVVNRDYTFYYVIRPQIELGRSDGVRYNTRTDFYISLSGIEKNGNKVDDESLLTSVKDIAVYLDGYTYHATKENSRFYNDLQKRLAIVESGNRLTWTMSWMDIERFDAVVKENDNPSKVFKRDKIWLDKHQFRDTISKFEAIPYWKVYKSDFIDTRNSFERLLWLLSNPLDENHSNENISLLLALHQERFGQPSVDEDKIDQILIKPFQSLDDTTVANNRSQGKFYVFPELSFANSEFASTKVAIKISDLSLKSSVGIKEIKEDLDKDTWEGFWQLFNLIQTNCHFIGDNSFTDEPETVLDDSVSHDKYDCLKYHDVELHEIVRQLIDNNVHFNKEGGFYIEVNGQFAEAMLGFEGKKIFIRPLSDMDKKLFENAGYKEMEPSEFNIKDLLI